MRITESFPGRDLADLCEEQLNLLKSLTMALEQVKLPENSKDSTTGILRGQLDDSFSEMGWRSSLMASSKVSIEFPTANYILDLYLDSSNESCEHKHRFFIEFCFDNRQAIGTNLLKFEVAAKNAIEQGLLPLPILLCATSMAIKKFGWDGGVASYQEYDHAIRIPYRNIIDNPPILIALS